jgi:YD repeat-containing protein
MRRLPVVRRLCLVVVPVLALTIAVPLGSPRPERSEFPLAGFFDRLLARPAWSFDPPSTPDQTKGGSLKLGSESTRASGGAGRGATVADSDGMAAKPDTPEFSTATAITGFSEQTSARVAARSTATVNFFQNADGSTTEQVYEAPVNYRDEEGLWQPIEHELTEEGDGWLRPAAHGLNIGFVSESRPGGQLVTIGLGEGRSLSYGLAGAAAVEPSVAGNTATYAGILPGVDLELAVLDEAVKETLVLHSPSAGNEWVFPLDLDGLTTMIEPDGSVSLRDSANELAGIIPRGFMVDSRIDPESAEGAYSESVSYELVLAGGQPALKVVADEAWLADPARVYPVRLDPTLARDLSYTTYVHTNETASNWAKPHMKTGKATTGVTARSYLYFPDFSGPDLGKRISEAQLNIGVMWSGTCSGSWLRVNDVTASWAVADVGTWASAPAIGAEVGAAFGYPTTAVCTNTNMTNLPEQSQWWTVFFSADVVNRWTTGGANNGIAVAGSLGVSGTEWKWLSSSNTVTRKPHIFVTYTDNVNPRIDRQYPPHGYQAPTLTPELLVAATDPDNGPEPLKYRFVVTEKPALGEPPLVQSAWSVSGTYQIPAGTLEWGKIYYWATAISDGSAAPIWTTPQAFIPAVPQPPITSNLSQNSTAHGFEPKIGNYTTEVTDAQVSVTGPPLAINRSYNSRDPRTSQGFGAGWSSIVDAKAQAVNETLVFTYPNGQQVAFGRKPDGSYVPPFGGVASTATAETVGYSLVDGARTRYVFAADLGGGVFGLTSLTDAQGRELQVDRTGARVTTLKSVTSGRTLELDWDGDRVGTVTNNAGEQWSYTYSGNRLVRVCPPDSVTACVEYAYEVTTSHHPIAVLDAGPRTYLRLTETSGAGGAKSYATDSLDLGSGRYVNVSQVAGAGLPGSTATSAVFNGTDSLVELSRSPALAAGYQSISLRFKTTGSGVLYSIQSGSIDTGSAGTWDPVLYVGTDGKLRGKLWNGDWNQIVSAATVNDGQWHHAVLSAAGTTQKMYLDGQEAGTLSGGPIDLTGWVNYAYVGTGRWDTLPQTSGTVGWFAGQISDVAHFSKPLTPGQAASMHSAAITSVAPLTTVTRPSGGVQASIGYDPLTGVVTAVTDANNGTWQIAAPERSGAGQGYAANVLAAGPVGYYRLADESNEINSGAITASQVTFGVDGGPLGPDQDVARFNGTSSYVRLPDSHIPAAGPASLSMWFRLPHGSTSGGVLYEYQHGPLTPPAGLQRVPALYVGTDGKLRGEFWTGAVAPITSSVTVNDGQWHHVALAGSSTSQTLYLDGASLGSLSGMVSPPGIDHALIGSGEWHGWPGTTGIHGYWPGEIGDYAYFKHQLTPNEVWAQYAARDLARSAKQLGRSNVVTIGPSTVSVWFKLPQGNSSGGVIYSYQSHAITDPAVAQWNPALYVGTDGKLRGKFWTGSQTTITSSATVNDGQWHHAVLAAQSSSQTLYLDGQAVGTDTGTLSAIGIEFAYLGTGKWLNWPGTGGAIGLWPGSISDFVYDTAEWSPSLVSQRFAAGQPTGEADIAPAGTPVKIVKVTDPAGKTITNSYDIAAGGRQIEIADARGSRTRFGYDINGFLRSTVDPNGNVLSQVHDDRGNVISQTTCQNHAQDICSTVHYGYVSHPDPANLSNDKLEWASDGRSASREDTTFRTAYAYDEWGNRLQSTDPLGRINRTAYTDGNLMLASHDDLSGTGRYVRVSGTEQGLPGSGYSLWELEVYSSSADPAVANRNLALNRPVTVSGTEASANVASRAADGDPATRWSSGNGTAHWIYVDLGASYPVNRVKLLWEKAFGKDYTVDISADGVTWSSMATVLDWAAAPVPAGLPYRILGAAGATQTTTYDAKGEVTEVVDAAGARVRYERDVVGRVTKQVAFSNIHPAGLATDFTYDPMGRVLTVTEPLVTNRVTGEQHTKVTTTAYNDDGHLESVVVSDDTGADASRTITAGYNMLGQKISQSDAYGRLTLFDYDLFGRVTKQTSPDGTTTEAGYDDTGNQITVEVNDQLMEERGYDAAGRLASVKDVMGWYTLYTYTDNNLLATVTRKDPGTLATYVSEANTYDAAGNLLTQITNNGITQTNYTVDKASRVISELTDPSGVKRAVSYVYGADDTVLTHTRSGPDGSEITDAVYDTAGRALTQSIRVPGGAASPASWWKLGESVGTTASDSMAAGKHGTLNGSVTWADDAATFDNANDNITTTGPVLDTTNSFTVSFWAKAAASGSWRTAVSQDGNSKSGFIIVVQPNGSTWEIHNYSNDTNGSTDDAWAAVAGAPAGQWAHITGIYDKSAGKLRLHVNAGAAGQGNAISVPMAAGEAYPAEWTHGFMRLAPA